MHYMEFNKEIAFLNKSLQTCKNNQTILKSELRALTQVMNTDKDDKYFRLKTYFNDRYFINEEMIEFLTFARAYMISNKTVDSVYNSYINRFKTLSTQYITKSTDPDFKKLYTELKTNYSVLFIPTSYSDTI